MKWAVIATWDMAEAGIQKAAAMLENGSTAKEAVIAGVKTVEDNPALDIYLYGMPQKGIDVKEQELERIMYDFINGEIDVLVSTTMAAIRIAQATLRWMAVL